MKLSVIICAHNPNQERLEQTLHGLRRQTLAQTESELLLIDNASSPPLVLENLPTAPENLRIIQEPTPGLTPARLRGISEARGDLLIFVDDDNVLCPDYLEEAQRLFQQTPNLGAAGGLVHPSFESAPPPWLDEFRGLLALHDHGPELLIARGGASAAWPSFAPVGAGLCIRKSHAKAYSEALASSPQRQALDRRAGELTSGGDNDMVFTALRNGADVAYSPGLSLTHLIPASRLQPNYLAKLNRGIQRSWVRVLSLHGVTPWPPIPRWSVCLRSLRAWIRTRAWKGPVENIRYQGLVGRFQGQADLQEQ